LKLQALRIGDLGVAAIPNEVFALTGLKIKAQSPFLTTFNIELANGSEGYKKAEVTLGGVDTRDLSSQTMESKQPGLYFIGEVVDVTGWLGGYNFQWAWASAHACATALAQNMPQEVI
jgi:predicted flavoprotein YhiN